jgi:phage tail sheath protein FI
MSACLGLAQNHKILKLKLTIMAYTTPGVKPIEKRVFGRTVLSKVTALPIFIGYTQRQHPLQQNGASSSGLRSSQSGAGGRSTSGKGASGSSETAAAKTATATAEAAVEEKTAKKKTTTKSKAKKEDSAEENTIVVHKINNLKEYYHQFGGGDYTWEEKKMFYLFESIKLFYANGGSTCYIASVGTYSNGEVVKEELEAGIDKVFELAEANLVLIPDAVSLADKERGSLYNELLLNCSPDNKYRAFINQFAILDAKEGVKKYSDESETLRNIVEGDHLVHGAMYHPWLHTDVISRTDVEMSLLDGDMGYIEQEFNLSENGWAEYKSKSTKSKANYLRRSKKEQWEDFVNETIKKNSLLPPSGAVAGAFVRNDEKFGIQKAPANINLRGVVELNAPINDTNQGQFNAPAESGKSINCIRSFVNNDIKIWGARTMDYRGLDYRYVNTRRTMSMLQDSIKNLLEQFVFENNDSRTWLKIRASLSKFLKGMLSRGVLYGTTPSQAYEFAVGFGETMDENDILEGIIRVEVKLALIRPAEFIEIIFEQKTMEGAVSEGGEGGEDDAAE